MDVQILSYISLVLYAIADSFVVLNLARSRQLFRNIGLIVFAVAILVHGYVLYAAIDINHLQNLSTSNVLSMIVWEAAVILWFAALRLPVVNLFLVIAPCAMLSLLGMIIFPGERLIDTQLDSKLFLHITFSIMTFSVFTLAFIQAFLLSIQHQLLKKKQVLTVRRIFPSVELMDRLLFILIHTGFVMLTTIIISSFALDDFLQLSGNIQQKVLISVVAWLVFGAIILFRKFKGWQGLKAACWSMVAYLILLLAYFSSRLLY